jgi:3,4-dihydroxyphenylacetate 2,3-dioxygenase
MGSLALAAKVTHVPSMLICERPGPFQGRRDEAIEGHREIGRRMQALGVDTIVILDTHWLVNTGYHINAMERFKGAYASNEFPHLIDDMRYDIPGNPQLGDAIAARATENGVKVLSHHIVNLDLEYGTLVPLHYMDPESAMKVVSIAAWCPWHDHGDSRIVGRAIREAIQESDSTVALIASGSLSHRIHDSRYAAEGLFEISGEFNRQVDLRVLELWEAGRFAEFVAMLPDYATACHGEGLMHDTAMLLGALGWDEYSCPVEIVTPWFPSSGTGQVNAVFPVAA